MDSNYTKQARMARALFLEYDQNAMIERYGLRNDKQYLYVTMLGERYRISRSDGRVEAPGISEKDTVKDTVKDSAGDIARDPGKDRAKDFAEEPVYVLCEDYNIVMTIYDILCYPKERPQLSGEWCPLYNLQATMSSPGTGSFVKKYEDAFAGKTEQLRRACEKTGGREPSVSAGADVCWQFDVFPCFPVQFRFWDRDEEFPAKIQLLWDRNSLQFMHYETLYYVLGVLLSKLLDAADLS